MPLSLEIVTPQERVLSTECDEVRLPGLEGGFGVRPGHTPLVAALAAGELVIVRGEVIAQRYAVGEGFAEVSLDKVRVLVEEAVRAEDLDQAKIVAELQERQKALQGMKSDDPEYEAQRAQVERVAARALVAAKK